MVIIYICIYIYIYMYRDINNINRDVNNINRPLFIFVFTQECYKIVSCLINTVIGFLKY